VLGQPSAMLAAARRLGELCRSAKAHERMPGALLRCSAVSRARKPWSSVRDGPRARGEHLTNTGASKREIDTLEGARTPREGAAVR
jgi:hypothetical protein